MTTLAPPSSVPVKPHYAVRWDGNRSYLVRKSGDGREERVTEPDYPGLAIREWSARTRVG